jgi:threonine/homoserine/homoserine lactone efflux protein
MSIELWVVYFMAAVGLSLTPGPNGLLALTHGAKFGFRAATFTVLGGAAGFFILIAVSLAGMGALLLASETAFTAAKLAGAAYLVYLGVQLWRSPAPVVAPVASGAGRPGASVFRSFAEGFLVAVSNPKGIVFFAALLPQFMTPGASYLLQLTVLGGTFVVVEIIYELLLAGLAHRIAPWLSKYGRAFNKVTGGTFVGIGAMLASASR